MISKEKKQAIMAEYARTEGDTGSPEVQVAVPVSYTHLDVYKRQGEKIQRSGKKRQSEP